MADPIGDFLTRRRAMPSPEDDPSLESVDELRGTVFDASDPIAQFRRRYPQREPPGLVRRGIDWLMRPLPALADPLERNAEYLLGTIPPEQTTVAKASPLSLLKAFGAGVNKTLAGFTAPIVPASFVPGPIGVGARAMLAGEQVPAGITETAAGIRERDPWKTAGGVANTALGAALVAGDIYRDFQRPIHLGVREGEIVPPESEALARRPPPPPPRGGPPPPPPEPPRRLPGGEGPDFVEGDFTEPPPPPGLPPGNPPRFVGGPEGVVDVPKDYPNDPIAAWREASGLSRPPRALLPARSGEVAQGGIPPPPPPPVDEFFRELQRRTRAGDPLADLELQLYPAQNEGVAGEQLGLNALAQLPEPEAPRGIQPAPLQPPPDLGPGGPTGGPEVPPVRPGSGPGPIGPGAGPAPLGEPPADVPPVTGEVPQRGDLERPTAPESGFAPSPGGASGVGGGRPARRVSREQSLVNDLIDQAVADGYQGDPNVLRSYLDDTVQMMKEIDYEWDQSGRKPENLLRAIAKAGGISLKKEAGNVPGYEGNVGEPKAIFGDRDLRSIKGMRGIFTRGAGSRGLSLDGMVEALRQEPEFQHIRDINDLLTELQDALFKPADAGLEGKLARAGVRYGGTWWKDLGGGGEATFDPAELEFLENRRLANTPVSGNMTYNIGELSATPRELSLDELERQFAPVDQSLEVDRLMAEQAQQRPVPPADILPTGEAQPRLPEAGQVRELEQATPTFEAPFSLTGEADATRRELERALNFTEPAEPVAELEQALAPSTNRPPDQAPAPGLVRLYRVEPANGAPAAEEGTRGRWFADDRHLAQAKYDRTAGPGVVKYIDIPEGDLVQYRRAAEMAGASRKADGLTRFLLPAGEANRADVFAELPATEAPSARGAVAPNVRDYLVKQLGYTPEEVAAFEPDEARRIGREQIAHPEREARRAPPPPAAIAPLAERGTLPGDRAMNLFDRLRGARGQQRRARLQRRGVPPSEPHAVEGAPLPKTPQERQAAGEALTAKERQSLGLPEPTTERKPRNLREQGASPRQIERRVRRMDAWMDDPSPENFARWVEEVSGQAERVNERQLRGGTGEEGKMPPKSPSGETLAGSPFPGFQLLADPRILRRVAAFLVSNEPADRLLRGAIFGAAGAFTSDDHRLRNALYGVVAGMMGPEIARAWASDFVALAKGQLPHAPRGLPRVYEPRGNTDLGVIENLMGTKAHTIPEQFAQVRPAVEALGEARATGRMPSRTLFASERYTGATSDIRTRRLNVQQRGFLKPEIQYLRSEAEAATKAGKVRLGSYLNAYADELAGVMTRSEKLLLEAGVSPKLVRRLSSEGANQIYRSGLAFNVGSATVNRLMQPLLAAPYVGLRNVWKAYAPLSEAEKGLSKIRRPIDIEDVQRPAWKFLDKYDDIASSLMRFGDNQNRQGAYAAAHLAAEQAGASPREAYLFARDVSEKTQGLFGLLSGNPRWRGPLIKTLRPFTKYPILITELANDWAVSTDPRVRWRGAAILGAVWAFSQVTGIDLFDLLVSGPRYGGSAVLRGAMDLYAHATNQAKDHKVLEWPGQGFADSDIGTMVYPVGVKKAIDTARRFATFGTGPHKTRTPGGALEPVTPMEDLMNLFGLRTTRQTERQRMLDDAYQQELAAAAADTQASAQAKRDFYRAMDQNDLDGAQEALARMPPNTRRTVLKTQSRDRFERLLHATPRKRRPELRDTFGELEQELRGPR